jgi:hypothetical protein
MPPLAAGCVLADPLIAQVAQSKFGEKFRKWLNLADMSRAAHAELKAHHVYSRG